MNKKLLALLAVAAMGVSVAGATPQTAFNKGEVQIDLGASNIKAENGSGSFVNSTGTKVDFDSYSSDSKWNFDGGVTYALGDKTAIQYNYQGLNVKGDYNNKSYDLDNRMHEVNVVQSLNKNLAVYGGWANIGGDVFDAVGEDDNNIAQIGLIAKAPIGSKAEVYAKGALGTKDTSIWEVGAGYKITPDLDIKAGYKRINTELTDDSSVTFKGFTTGLSYRFGGHSEKAPAPAPVEVTPAPIAEGSAPAPVAEAKDYYVNSIYFDSDIDVPRADQAPNLASMIEAANQYPNATIKLVGNADSSYNAEYNQALSERRVQSVAQYAVNNGVDGDRLVGLANGDKKPAADNATAAGKAENRRVDVYVNR